MDTLNELAAALGNDASFAATVTAALAGKASTSHTHAQGDVTKVSVGLLHSLDHSYFVGLMTNMLFGSILVFLGARMAQWPWADNVIFWGLNVGAAAFVAVLLIVGSGEGKAAFTHPVAFVAPIMGLSALLGVATFLMRLQGAQATAPAVAPAR